ncbi:hypothetical protein GCM10009000_073420 [Halobacterium noricense]
MHAVEPVVVDGTLYLAVATAHTPSTSEGYLAAYDTTTREELWRRDDISRPETPTVGDGTVYFDTTGTEDTSGTGFFALDSDTGETKWHKSGAEKPDISVFADGRLFCNTGGTACELDAETGDVCYADGTLFYGDGAALSAEDGAVLWDASDDGDALRTVADGLVYGVVAEYDAENVIRARSTDDGSIRWSYSLGKRDYWSSNRLVVANGYILFTDGNTIRALDAKTGDEAWTHETDAELSGPPTVGGDTLYASGRTTPEPDVGDAVVIAIDVASGEREWEHSFGSWDFDEYGPAARGTAVADGRLYTATFPMGSTIDWMYTKYADFHVLASDASTGTTETTEPTETTNEGTTTDDGTTDGTTTTTAETTSDGTTSETPTETTTSGQTVTETTTQSTRTTATQASETTSSELSGGEVETTTTTTDGQPGFGIVTAIGGVAGVGAYLRRRIEREE